MSAETDERTGSKTEHGAETDRGAAPRDETLSLGQVMASAVQAAFGVQSARNHERDFTHGSAKTFIVAGFVLTTLFVLTLVGIVALVNRFVA